MKIYLALNNTKIHINLVKDFNPENVLISYQYFKDVNELTSLSNNWLPKNLILDSGAFSVWTKQGVIDINKYLEFCKKSKEEFGDKTNLFFVNLDVLPGKFKEYPTKEQRENSAEQGWKNMEFLEAGGVKVIPVFHQHEDFKWLEKMMKYTDYIGISPANDEPQSSKDRWLSQVFSMLKADYKTHGFAVTSFNTLKKFPFYSADSSSWTAGARYARIPVFYNGKFECINFKEKADLSKLLRKTNCNTAALDSYHERMKIGINSYLEMEKFLTDLWTKRGIVFKD